MFQHLQNPSRDVSCIHYKQTHKFNSSDTFMIKDYFHFEENVVERVVMWKDK